MNQGNQQVYFTGFMLIVSSLKIILNIIRGCITNIFGYIVESVTLNYVTEKSLVKK